MCIINFYLLTYLLVLTTKNNQTQYYIHQKHKLRPAEIKRSSEFHCTHSFVHCHMTGHGVRGQIISNIFTYNSQPVSNFAGLMSTPMMRAAPAFWQPSRAARPTAPRPNTAQVEPGSTFAVFSAAPYPVEIPHPSKHTLSSPAALSTYSKIQSTQHMAHTSPFSSRYIST